MAMLVGTASAATLETGDGTHHHYGNPQSSGGCMGDEQTFQHIDGEEKKFIQGDVCAPPCYSNGSCPKDIPSGITAIPQCLLTDQKSGKNYCALLCDPYGQKPLNCGKEAKCRPVKGQLVGICTYDVNDGIAGDDNENGDYNVEIW